MTSVSAGHIIPTPTQPVESGRWKRGSNPQRSDHESHSLTTELLVTTPSPWLRYRCILNHRYTRASFNKESYPSPTSGLVNYKTPADITMNSSAASKKATLTPSTRGCRGRWPTRIWCVCVCVCLALVLPAKMTQVSPLNDLRNSVTLNSQKPVFIDSHVNRIPLIFFIRESTQRINGYSSHHPRERS